MNIKKLIFPGNENGTGKLAFVEAHHDIPFEIKRIYYIYDVVDGARRGFHAHKNLKQVLFCIHGSCKLLLDDGINKAIVQLNNPTEGILLEEVVWREMYDFSKDAVLLVLASEYYDEADYIRDYNSFLEFQGRHRI